MQVDHLEVSSCVTTPQLLCNNSCITAAVLELLCRKSCVRMRRNSCGRTSVEDVCDVCIVDDA